MNRAARNHLLSVLDRRGRPSFRVIYPGTRIADLEEAIRELGRARSSIVLPPGSTIEFIKPRGAVAVVAGKGARRRGVRHARPMCATAGIWYPMSVPSP